MIIDKIINNNIVSSIDSDGREIVVMGRGIGFGKKAGGQIEDSKIEKVFKMDSDKQTDQFIEMMHDIPHEHVEVTMDIVKEAHDIIGTEFSKTIYLSLMDHINFALERYDKDINFSNPLEWEIKKFYKKEYEAGKKAREMIKSELGVELPLAEATSIAMHFINAEYDTDNMEETVNMTKLIQNVLNIVKYHYNMDFDEESLHYNRFITHLKFFAQRIFSGTELDDKDSTLYNLLKKELEEDYKCTEKIKTYIQQEYGHKLTEEEMLYLTVHIRRITQQE